MSLQALINDPNYQIPSKLLNIAKLYDSGERTLELYTNFIINFADYLVQHGYRNPDDVVDNNTTEPATHVIKYLVCCPASEYSGSRDHTIFIHMYKSTRLRFDECVDQHFHFGITIICNGSGFCPREAITGISLDGLFGKLNGFGLKDDLVKGVIDG